MELLKLLRSFNIIFVVVIQISMAVSAHAAPLTACGAGTGGLPSPWVEADLNLYYTLGNVGVGTNNPQATLDIDGSVRFEDVASCTMLGTNASGDLVCSSSSGSGGTPDITAVTAGFGLSGGATSGDASLAVDPTVIQRRVSSSCAEGQSIRAIAQDGTVTCEVDDNSGTWGSIIGTLSAQTDLQSAFDAKQAADADLSAIAGLGGSSGLLRKTAANTWSLDANSYLTGNQTITLSGDITGSGSTAITTTLNTVTAAKGGTGQTSYTIGDLLYATGSSTLTKLSDVATGNSLISGGVGVAPSWGKIGLTTHVSGTLPIANGGTALSSTPSNGQLLIGNGTGYTLANLTSGDSDRVTVTNGSGTITISGPQDINTTSSPSFAGLTVNGTESVSGNLAVDTNTLYVDATNNRVGVKNASPSYPVDVTGDARVTGNLYVDGQMLTTSGPGSYIAPSDKGLVIYLRNETVPPVNEVYDRKTFTLEGAAMTVTTGKFGNAIAMADSSASGTSYISSGWNATQQYDPGTKDFTISFWYYNLPTTGSWSLAWRLSDYTNYYGYRIWWADWNPSYTMINFVTAAGSSGNLNLAASPVRGSTTWRLATFVYKRNSKLFYYDNGVLQGSLDISAYSSYDLTNSAGDLRFGSFTPQGSIDEYMMWHRALSPQEVLGLYMMNTEYGPSGEQAAAVDMFQEIGTTPSSPTAGSQAKLYLKGDKLVVQYNDGGTVRYKYLDLTGTGVTWVHSTTAP